MANSTQRTDRTTEERQDRRRRRDTNIDGSQSLKLSIPEAIKAQLDSEGRVARWVNDEGNRIHEMTVNDDYDRVDGVEPRVVGTSKDGKPIKSYLHSKPKQFFAEDMAARESERISQERAMMRGEGLHNPHAGTDGFYADVANTIKRGGAS